MAGTPFLSRRRFLIGVSALGTSLVLMGAKKPPKPPRPPKPTPTPVASWVSPGWFMGV